MTPATATRTQSGAQEDAARTAVRLRLEEEMTAAAELARSMWQEREALASEVAVEVQFDDESGEGAGVHVDRDRDLALHNAALARVEQARDALHRLEAGTYGRCTVCREPISPERLEALPSTTTCVRCKSGGLVTRLGR